jgi:hypothetical protein
MAYSSVIDDRKARFGSSYDRLRVALSIAGRSPNEVYVLRIHNAARVPSSLHREIPHVVEMPEAIDFLVEGTYEHAQRIAQKIHNATKQIVGGVRVQPPYLTGIIQAEAELAREFAEKSNLPYHIKV